MSKYQFYILLLFILLNSACQKKIILNLPVGEEQIVVDAYIENNKYPRVVLTRSMPFFGEIDSASLKDYIVTTAKVTISSETTSEILTLDYNDDFFPPYVYSATKLKGITGEKFYLKVEIENKIITSSTTIPQKPIIDSLWFVPNKENDTLGVLWMKIQDDADENNYYRVLTKRKGKDSNYISSLIFSVFSDKSFNGKEVNVPVYMGLTSYANPFESIYFNIKDTIFIKLSTMDKESFDCWTSIQNEMIGYGNPLSTPNNPIVSNIKNGIGVWSGYGSFYSVFYPEK
jgi:hypothetical protein